MAMLFAINIICFILSLTVYCCFHIRRIKKQYKIRQELNYVDILKRFVNGKYNKSFAPVTNLTRKEEPSADIFDARDREKRITTLAPYDSVNSENRPLKSNQDDKYGVS